MLIKAKLDEKKAGRYIFNKKTTAIANACLTKAIFQEIWNGFCCHAGRIEFKTADELTFKIGDVATLRQPENGYVMDICKEGVSIAASDEKNLTYGFFALLERISPVCTKQGQEEFVVDCCRVEDRAEVQVRMTHLCIFPETTLAFVRKFIRLAAFLRYTHIVVEFWGTLQYDCLKELAWKEYSYTKDEIRPLFQEARELGIEVVPMFNHWGHATGCRVKTGKHVVLDQNLSLAPLFSASGWEWGLSNPDVIDLHKKIRNELIELCGEGKYFHIGCDEAYSANSNEAFENVVNYINNVSEALGKCGRRAIIWGDMLLHKATLSSQVDNCYTLLCPNTQLQEILLKNIARSVVIGDWEYNAKKYPIETALFFKDNGFDVLCCPWDRNGDNIIASAKTIKDNNLLGVLHTTWQSIGSIGGMWALAYSAALSWGSASFQSNCSYQGVEVATILRKLDFPEGNYENSGWMKNQIREELS